MNYRNIRDLSQDLLTWELPAGIEVIVGIPRSGLLAATILALHRNIPFTDLHGFLEGRMLGVGLSKNIRQNLAGFLNTPRTALVIDDSCASGNQMRQARKTIEEAQLGHRPYFAVVYMNPGMEGVADFYRRLLPTPRIFEWNLLHCWNATRGCWDLDGVLCRDPTPQENDDGPRYLKFICEVPARVRPSLPLGWIVTSRLEKYRSPTERWLATNGIRYKNLIMLDMPDKESRVAAKCHASFKAAVYKSTKAGIFIESSRSQAVEIARLSGKYTICFETQECIPPGPTAQLKQECRNIARVVLRRAKSRITRLHGNCMESGTERGRRGWVRRLLCR